MNTKFKRNRTTRGGSYDPPFFLPLPPSFLSSLLRLCSSLLLFSTLTAIIILTQYFIIPNWHLACQVFIPTILTYFSCALQIMWSRYSLKFISSLCSKLFPEVSSFLLFWKNFCLLTYVDPLVDYLPICLPYLFNLYIHIVSNPPIHHTSTHSPTHPSTHSSTYPSILPALDAATHS